MTRVFPLFLLLALIGSAAHAVFLQNEDLPRRIENPETIQYPGGSRIEFGSFLAPSLRRNANYSVFLPPSYDQGQALPVVYFLHGMWNDHTSWIVERYGSIPEQLEGLMMARKVPEALIVSPDGENSFYTDYLDDSQKFEQLIYDDLIKTVESQYTVIGERRARGIAGVSMGGYGALKIAMKFPQLYSSVVAISPIVFTGEDPSGPIMSSNSRSAHYFQSALRPVFGMPFEPRHWRANSLEVLAQNAEIEHLEIYFSYGTADRYNRYFPMRKGVEILSRILKARSIPHRFHLIENGPHGWDLVRGQLQEVFTFVTQTF
jgi:enterochelin esterase family protein